MKNIDRRGKNGPPRTKMCNFDPKNCRRNSQFPKKMAQNFTKMAKNIFSCGIYPYFSLSPFAKPDFFLFCALCSPMSGTWLVPKCVPTPNQPWSAHFGQNQFFYLGNPIFADRRLLAYAWGPFLLFDPSQYFCSWVRPLKRRRPFFFWKSLPGPILGLCLSLTALACTARWPFGLACCARWLDKTLSKAQQAQALSTLNLLSAIGCDKSEEKILLMLTRGEAWLPRAQHLCRGLPRAGSGCLERPESCFIIFCKRRRWTLTTTHLAVICSLTQRFVRNVATQGCVNLWQISCLHWLRWSPKIWISFTIAGGNWDSDNVLTSVASEYSFSNDTRIFSFSPSI